MEQEELTSTFMMNLKWEKRFSLQGLYKDISAL